MCKTNAWKTLETRVQDSTLKVLASRSDGKIISVVGSVDSAEDAKDLLDYLESFRNREFQDIFAGQIAVETFIMPMKDN